ncbi:YbjN domain-containing protein [Micromonospora tulbaghiae]|uniref:YbjN domain-containing protein n=1 Tax=Micromonospora tulbaghiae TaxID=479978 RepID=UPI0036A4B1EE
MVSPYRHPAEQAVAFLKALAERHFSGVSVPDWFELTPQMDGFAVHHDGGLVLVYADWTSAGNNGGQWQIQMSCALAADVEDVGGATAWVNAKNRNTTVGRYYCAVAQDGSRCCVVFEADVWGGLLDNLLSQHTQPVRDLLSGYLAACLETATTESKDFAGQSGGRRLTGSLDDVVLLLTCTSG